MTENGLARRLQMALSGRTNGRTWGDDFRHCVPALLPALRMFVSELKTPQVTDASPPLGAGELAEQLAAKVKSVLDFLERNRKRLEQLPGTDLVGPKDIYRLAGLDAADVKLFGGRTATLMDVLYLAGYWQGGPKRKQKPGPDPFDFVFTAQAVGCLLQRHVIPLTKAKGGHYGRVLAVVYAEAGFPTRDVYRDISRALAASPRLIRAPRCKFIPTKPN